MVTAMWYFYNNMLMENIQLTEASLFCTTFKIV